MLKSWKSSVPVALAIIIFCIFFVGRYRVALTDEEMIAFLNKHRTEFDSLVSAYYKDVAVTRSYSEIEARLKERLRSLRLCQIEPDGAFLQPNFGKHAPLFTDMGVSLRPIDHGPYPWWKFNGRYTKSYLYMPKIPPHPKSTDDPVKFMLSTGNYKVEANTDRPSRPIGNYSCAVRQIDSNWYIQSCDADTLLLE